MSSIDNFTGVNDQRDILPPILARSAFALIRGLQAKVQQLGLDSLVQTYQTHTLNTNNPHVITFDDFPDAVIQGLYPYYVKITTAPLGLADYLVLCQDPIVVLELIRRLILNGYLYQDTVGPVVTPVYTADVLTGVIPPNYPMYFASYMLEDPFLTVVPDSTVVGVTSRVLPQDGYGLTILVSVILNGVTGSPTLVLSNTTGYQVILDHMPGGVVQIKIVGNDGSDEITSVVVGSDVNPDSIISVSTSMVQFQSSAPFAYALTMTPTSATYTYAYMGAYYTVVLWLKGSLRGTPLMQMAVNAAFAPPTSPGNHFKTIMIYPDVLNADQIEALVSTL